MAIGYKDFYPEVLKSGFFTKEQESLSGPVARASRWIEETGVQVINIETVVLPNIDSSDEASQAGIRTSGERSSYWYQVVRVWFKQEGR